MANENPKYAYEKRNYSRIAVLIPNTQIEKLRELAKAQGVSMNRYVVEALEAKSGLKLTLDNALPWMQKNEKDEQK